MSNFISLESVSLKFRIYRDANPSLRSFFVNLMHGEKQKNFTEFFALKNITLDIRSGDRLGIVGLNGAGKSTLLKTIAGIYAPYTGKLGVHGKITPLMELGAGFDPEQTGRENIYLNGAMLGFSPAEMKDKERAIAEFAELQDFLDMPVKYFSSGMYGRLSFSIATMTEPEILLIDEVFATGDGHFVEKSTQRIERMIEQSKILVVVSHNLAHIQKLCNRAIFLDQGNLIGNGPTQEVLEQYQAHIAHLGG